ncbi:fcbf9880-a541-4ed8-9612-7c3e1297d1ad [Thermothielavioides terrestris]|uniref:Fcbf9880-a541-4ed8-9612-7c3e1297d1ad n=1 Tax=Thermothielavioides terrestris TaxID=2587410 RepID=A0A446BCI3_9PEZI|nr:fcbf9880-a541-4ed8-9612-7c3e1297d1ad [Thermothielavioides terrestris]
MATRRASLKSFLAAAKKALVAAPAQRQTPLHFVIGNESADLDSLCSALVYAYFRTHTPPHTLHIPLSNLPRADLTLRPELSAVLTPAGLRPDDLITLTDLPGEDALSPQDTRWLLVDHNVLTGDLAARFSSQVVGCIDHHEDEGVIPHALPADQPRIFAKCGSCMSLVLDKCRATWDALAASATASACDDGTPAAACDAALARVALAPILIDTTNLTSKDKTTDWDVRAAQLAEAKLLAWPPAAVSLATMTAPPAGGGAAQQQQQQQQQHQQQHQPQAEPGSYDRAAYYAALTHLKEQIQGLTYRDVLRKDYKRWGEGRLAVGVSTVVQGLGYVLRELGSGTGPAAAAGAVATGQGDGGGNEDGMGRGEGSRGKAAFLDALRAWAAEQRLDVAVVMTVSRPGGVFTRELLVWGLNGEGVKVMGEFVRRYGDALGLETWEGGELDGA